MIKLAGAAMGCVACLALFASTTAEKPTRSECTIGFRLDWAPTGIKRDRVEEALASLPKAEPGIIKYLAGMKVAPEMSEVYIAFRHNCRDKEKMANNIIEYWRSIYKNMPEFDRIPDPIIHSPRTIEMRGPVWSDG